MQWPTSRQVRKLCSRFSLVKEISADVHVAIVRVSHTHSSIAVSHIPLLLSNILSSFCFGCFLLMWTCLRHVNFDTNMQGNNKLRWTDITVQTKVDEQQKDTSTQFVVEYELFHNLRIRVYQHNSDKIISVICDDSLSFDILFLIQI